MNFESKLAESVFRSKYLLEGETEPEQAVERIVKSVGKVFPEIEDEAREYINKQWFLPGGGLWRGAGNPNKNVSHINCTTLKPVEDNLEDIFKSLYHWGKFAAFGQGEGIDISNLRPKGAKVHNSSRESTGSVSFMYLYDAVLKVIAQQGRRGASLVSIRDSHPDIEDFICVKDKPESDKSRIDTANISIQATDAFMQAVAEDKDWLLHFENKYERIEKTVKARDVFEKICTMARKRGDPGLQFIDTWREFSNSDQIGHPLVSSNACGEIPNDPYNVCDLSHINLSKYNEFKHEGFVKLIKFGVKFLNAILILEYDEDRSPIPEQKEKLKLVPRIGLGDAGFADYLIDKKIRYGSKESILERRYIGQTMAKHGYQMSHDLGKQFGSFPGYSKEKYLKSGYIKSLLENNVITEDVLDYQYNVQLFTIAPTGSASLIANVGGAGIEPLYSRYLVRRERSTTNEWKEWFTFNAYVERYLIDHGIEVTKENADKLTDDYWAMSFDVPHIDKIHLVAEAQRWIDSAISVTFNLDENCTVKDIENIYIDAWRSKLKGITVYREGSLTGVLITEKNYNKMIKEKDEARPHKTERRSAPKRPIDLPCSIDLVKVKGESFLVLVGLYEDDPYEIFVTNLTEGIKFPDGYKKGIIRKQGKGNYNLIVQNGVEKIAIDNIGITFNNDYESMSRLISASLRHGVPLQFVVDQLSKDKNFSSFGKAISRVLKHYIKEGEKVLSSEKCPECGDTLIFTDGCKSCSCGWSRC